MTEEELWEDRCHLVGARDEEPWEECDKVMGSTREWDGGAQYEEPWEESDRGAQLGSRGRSVTEELSVGSRGRNVTGEQFERVCSVQ